MFKGGRGFGKLWGTKIKIHTNYKDENQNSHKLQGQKPIVKIIGTKI
jgi:hypothetical protein